MMQQGDADLLAQLANRLNGDVLAETGGRILGAVVVAWMCYWALILVLRRIEQSMASSATGTISAQEQRTRTLISLLRSVGVVLIAVVLVFMVLNALGVQLGPLLAGAGVLGLAVSFGAQSLVKDVISGLFMLFENQFGVGDVIRIEGVSGAVERMTLRVVVLRDVHGAVHIVPNGQITKVSNLTRSWSRAVLDVAVAHSEDPDRAMAVLREVGEELYQDPEWKPLLVEPVQVPGIENLTDAAVTIRVMAKTLPLKQWDVARELRRRIKLRFDRDGIEIPHATQTVYWGEGQQPGFAMSGPAAANALPLPRANDDGQE
ncbi:MAG TPA: mechanosensitive ion channel domain-containing protein [Longimicrobium sp.]|jgi:small conductance mechanosensitive channel|uniref:mechanosensitive ion channel family protein n=1 Tax=Longimicrobium sp. TaxID=2029185 RepID=UPI002EDB5B1E